MKRRQLSIQGIKNEGTWITDPTAINFFPSSFFEKLKKFNNTQVVRRSNRFRALSSDQVSILEAPVTEYLVREAAWACGSDKSPSTDRFTFSFYIKYWDLIKTGVMDFVS